MKPITLAVTFTDPRVETVVELWDIARRQRELAVKALRAIKRQTGRHDVRYEVARKALVEIMGERG